jgi:predicted CXXCH cytochrome family protein
VALALHIRIKHPLASLIVAVALLPWLCKLQPALAGQQKLVASTPAATQTKTSDFVGSETCALCHADVANKFSSNPHAKLALAHDGKGATCESCHGPGGAHVSSGGDPTKILQLSKMSAKQIDSTCLSCHATAHPNFERSDHGKAGVGCTSCHSIHGYIPATVPGKPASPAAADLSAPSSGSPAGAGATPANAPLAGLSVSKFPTSGSRLSAMLKPDASISDPLQWSASSHDVPGENPNLLKASQPQLCFSCHADVKPAFSQPFHHKVNEGLMKCTDCHDSHGTFGNNQLRSTADQNMICAKCHTETRGPFVFEHAAVKAEGCLGCHTPHGSQNARLLNVPNINQMCNQCHSPVAAGTVHGMGAGSAELTPCISCHTMIHGSNINPAFIR